MEETFTFRCFLQVLFLVAKNGSNLNVYQMMNGYRNNGRSISQEKVELYHFEQG